jgi:hypothetical protein
MTKASSPVKTKMHVTPNPTKVFRNALPRSVFLGTLLKANDITDFGNEVIGVDDDAILVAYCFSIINLVILEELATVFF